MMTRFRYVLRIPTHIALAIISCYQFAISPFLGRSCRFEPTCSGYATQAINRFGVIKGCWLTIRRLSRCHPWCEGGYDPIPED